MEEKPKIKSFRDLIVYRESYDLSIIVAKDVLPKLPSQEKFDLTDQLSRASKAIPRLIAEGYAKKHQKAGFNKYLDDAMAEGNETIVCLEHCRDIYVFDKELIDTLVTRYDRLVRQVYRLSESWSDFKSKTKTTDYSGIHNYNQNQKKL